MKRINEIKHFITFWALGTGYLCGFYTNEHINTFNPSYGLSDIIVNYPVELTFSIGGVALGFVLLLIKL